MGIKNYFYAVSSFNRMLYAAVRPFAKLSLRYYFRRIDLAHLERIPQGVPVIFAVNHPTTFIEPCILACFQDNPLYFLARGDFFRSPFFARLLKGVHITPVYRLRDAGYGGLKQNYESFEKSYQTLTENKVLMILAEGRCIHEKRLRPIRKGTARIALGAITEKKLPEVYIVPIGANFTYADRPRTQVMLSCGEPMKASDYLKTYLDSEAAGIKALTDDLRKALLKEVIVIEDIADEPLVEHLLQLYRTTHYEKLAVNGVFEERRQLTAELKIANHINKLDAATKTEWNVLAHDYFSRLTHMKIDDAAFSGRYQVDAKRSTYVLLGLFPALLLSCWHLPVWLPLQWITGTKIKTVEFSGPVRWAGAIFLYLIYGLSWLIAGLLSANWIITLIGIIGPLSTLFIVNYFEAAYRWLLAWRVRRQPEHLMTYLKARRKELLAAVSDIWENEE